MERFRLFLVMSILCFSCHSEQTMKLEGKWKVKEVTINNESLLPHQRLQLQEELNSMVIDLKEDGAIIYSNFYRTGAHGNWNLSHAKDSLFINYQFERAVITDAYSFSLLDEKMTLKTSGFEGTNSVSLVLNRE